MDNRSIAAFIETNKTRMNSVIICSPSKGAGQEKRPTLNLYYKKKGGGSGEGGGSQNKLLTPSNRDEWRARGLSVQVTCQKPWRGVNIMTFDTWPKPSPL